MKTTPSVGVILLAFTALTSSQLQADNMASIAVTPATGAVTLVPRWSLGGNLAGFHHMAQDLSLGGGSNQFYSIKGTPIPDGGDIAAFTLYIAGSGAATNHADIGSKLTPESYSALTSADPDLGYGAVNLYFIHHKTSGDYFTAIVPSSGTASAVTDLKPMSGPGGPATLGDSGYFGLTFAAANLGYGLNYFYYFRSDPVTGFTRFGTLDPALLGTSADQFDLGMGGHNALAFTGTDVGYGTDKMYYLRLDPITGFTIFGTLHPLTGQASDIANLGSVFSTLTFVPGDVGFGSGQFYATGAINTTWQSVSFAAIADRPISAGSFTVAPSASSGLSVALNVVSGSVGWASISGPVAGVFTVTPTAPGLITLQATQVGQLAPTPYEFNMLRQSFTASGTTLLAITTQPTSQSAVIASTASFSVSATGTTALSYQWRKAGANITGNASATTSTLTLTNVQAGDAASYDVVVSNASGAIPSDAVILTVTDGTPVITNSPLTAAGTVGTPFSFTITASGSPTVYAASPLPAGLSIAAATGAITGTPTSAGTTAVLLSATNATSTGNATLTITIAAASVAPIITNNPLSAAGTVGAPFSFTVTASGTPTSYTASPLPAGLSIVAATGAITGTPTAVGNTSVLLGATNATGTGNATLTITVAAAGVAPIITNAPLTAAGTVGTPFGFTITAAGSPLSYSASGLPSGLTLNVLTGTISGTPVAAGTSTVTLGATNSSGTGSATLTITVTTGGVTPLITSASTAPGTVGTPFVTYFIVATGSPTTYGATGLPAGLSLNTLTGAINGTPTTAGTATVTLSAINSTGTGTATLIITIAPASAAPIVTSLNHMDGTVGTPFVTYLIQATGSPTSYGATGLPAGLSLNPLTGAINGTPTAAGTSEINLSATNSFGTGTAVLTIVIAPARVIATSGIVNFSARAVSGPGSQTLIMGFVVAGNGKNLLVRGIGPALTQYGITNALADPMLTLHGLTGAIATNDDWQINAGGHPDGTLIAETAALIGAFPLPDGSKDSALLVTTSDGVHTTGLLRPNSTTGVALTEIYDIDGDFDARLVNVSARMHTSADQGTLIAGLAVAGSGPREVLIRAVGPTLTSFGVTGVLVDPKISVYSDGVELASNDNWETGVSTSVQITAVSAQVGAFPLQAGSADAAVLLTLQPGRYTVHVTGVGATTGVALIEIYDTQ